MSAHVHDIELPNRSRLPEFPQPDKPDEPVFDFGPRYRKPYVVNCRFCQGLHLDAKEYEKCRDTVTGGW